MGRFYIGVAVALALMPFPAAAEDLCQAIALRDVAARGDSTSVMEKGTTQTAVTQLWKNIATGDTFFCSHGGSCYPTHVRIRGVRVEALRLENCTVGAEVSRDQEDILYAIEVDRSRNSPQELRFDDIENQLIEFGACTACADNATQHYLQRPTGQCGTLVRRALEGDREARRSISEDFPDFCAWDYGQQ
jgi:hypothetical protein